MKGISTMSDPISKPRIPLGDIATILTNRNISRASYCRVRSNWFSWLAATGQPRYSISLSPGEEDVLEFIDYQLSEDEKTACREWATEVGSSLLIVADELIHTGYRLTFTFDEKNGCIVVTVIGRSKTSVNYNKAMTTRHVDVEQALIMALYKQTEVFKGESWGASDLEATFG